MDIDDHEYEIVWVLGRLSILLVWRRVKGEVVKDPWKPQRLQIVCRIETKFSPETVPKTWRICAYTPILYMVSENISLRKQKVGDEKNTKLASLSLSEVVEDLELHGTFLRG